MPSSMTASGVQVSESAKAAPQKGTFDPKAELTVVETLVANEVHLSHVENYERMSDVWMITREADPLHFYIFLHGPVAEGIQVRFVADLNCFQVHSGALECRR